MSLQLLKINTDSTIKLNEEDLFIRFGKFLIEEYNFKVFSKFYETTKKFQLDLNEILLEYYENLDFNHNSNKLLLKLVKLVDIYFISFIKFTNDKFMNEFNSYFRNKKSNLHDIDPINSKDRILSTLQTEWILIVYNLEKYYNLMVENNNKKYKKEENNYLLDTIFEYLTFYSNSEFNENLLQITN